MFNIIQKPFRTSHWPWPPLSLQTLLRRLSQPQSPPRSCNRSQAAAAGRISCSTRPPQTPRLNRAALLPWLPAIRRSHRRRRKYRPRLQRLRRLRSAFLRRHQRRLRSAKFDTHPGSQAWTGGHGLGVSEAAIREVTTVAGNAEAESMRSAGGRTPFSTESGS